ncbi:MAG: hypothetical protein R3231_04460 [bacterium]|nr:hypothetical protein [bacterium]
MDELEKVLDGIAGQMIKQIEAMAKSEDTGDRKTQAEIISLLSQSWCSIIDTTSSAAFEMDDFMPEDLED